MRSSRTTISFNPIVTAYLCKQASKKDTSLQTESCSQWNHDQSFSPRFFFPPSSNGSSPSKEDLSRTRETLLYDRCQAEVQAGEKLGTTRNSARVRADEKPAHVITFPVTTRCREQFILLSIPFFIRAPPFCSLHLSSSSRIFLFLIVLGFFKSFVFLFFLRSFVSKQLILDRRLFCTFPFYLIIFILLFLMSSLA